MFRMACNCCKVIIIVCFLFCNTCRLHSRDDVSVIRTCITCRHHSRGHNSENVHPLDPHLLRLIQIYIDQCPHKEAVGKACMVASCTGRTKSVRMQAEVNAAHSSIRGCHSCSCCCCRQ